VISDPKIKGGDV